MFLSWTELMNTCVLSVVYISLLSFLSRFFTRQLGFSGSSSSSPRGHHSSNEQTDNGMRFLGCGGMPGGYCEDEADMEEDFTGEVTLASAQLEGMDQEKSLDIVPESAEDVGVVVSTCAKVLAETTPPDAQTLVPTNTLPHSRIPSLRPITTTHLPSPRPHSSPSFHPNPRRLSPLATLPTTPSLKRTHRIRRRSPALRPSSSCDMSTSSSSSPTTSASEHTVSPTSINSPDSSLTSSTSIIRTALDPLPSSSPSTSFSPTSTTTTSASPTTVNTSNHRRIKSFRVRVPDIHNFDDPDPFARDSPVNTPAASIRRGGAGYFSQGDIGGRERERETEAGHVHEDGKGHGKETRQGETFVDMGMVTGTRTEVNAGVVASRETTRSFWDDSDVAEDVKTGASEAGVGAGGSKVVGGVGSGPGAEVKMGRKVSLRVRENVAGIVSRLKRTASLNLTSGLRRMGRGRRME